MARGRQSQYDALVKPHLDKIRDWRKTGATVEQICDALGVGVSTFMKYKNDHIELQDAYKKGTTEFVFELKGELAKLATKHTVETNKVYKKKDEITGHETTYQEKIVKEVDADIAAINLLLKNLDKANWSDNPVYTDIRKRELEIKEKLAEMKEW